MKRRIRLVARAVDEFDMTASLAPLQLTEQLRKAQGQLAHGRGAEIDIELVRPRLGPLQVCPDYLGRVFGPVDLEVADVGVQLAAVQHVGEHRRDRLQFTVLNLERFERLLQGFGGITMVAIGQRLRRIDHQCFRRLDVDLVAAMAAPQLQHSHVRESERMKIPAQFNVAGQFPLLVTADRHFC